MRARDRFRSFVSLVVHGNPPARTGTEYRFAVPRRRFNAKAAFALPEVAKKSRRQGCLATRA
jgi:hypothetical protein